MINALAAMSRMKPSRASSNRATRQATTVPQTQITAKVVGGSPRFHRNIA